MTATINAGKAVDTAGNATAATSTDNSVTWNGR